MDFSKNNWHFYPVLSGHGADAKMEELGIDENVLFGVLPTKSSKHTLRDCTENEELLNTFSSKGLYGLFLNVLAYIKTHESLSNVA